MFGEWLNWVELRQRPTPTVQLSQRRCAGAQGSTYPNMLLSSQQFQLNSRISRTISAWVKDTIFRGPWVKKTCFFSSHINVFCLLFLDGYHTTNFLAHHAYTLKGVLTSGDTYLTKYIFTGIKINFEQWPICGYSLRLYHKLKSKPPALPPVKFVIFSPHYVRGKNRPFVLSLF